MKTKNEIKFSTILFFLLLFIKFFLFFFYSMKINSEKVKIFELHAKD